MARHAEYMYPQRYRRQGLYRSRRGILFGVCKGFAQYFDLSVFWARIILAACVFFTGIWPGVVVYVVAAMLMKREPYWAY